MCNRESVQIKQLVWVFCLWYNFQGNWNQPSISNGCWVPYSPRLKVSGARNWSLTCIIELRFIISCLRMLVT